MQKYKGIVGKRGGFAAYVRETVRIINVYIMAYDSDREAWEGMELKCMDGSRESLDKCLKLGADGVLLNNIEMALNWKAERF